MASNWKVVFHKVGTASDLVYNQKVTVIDGSGNVVGTFKGSSTPNPYKPRDVTIKGEKAYPYIKQGTYLLTHGTHKGKPALVVNQNGFVPTRSKNPNHPNYGNKANFIHIHWGYSITWKGSAGCPTIHPNQWLKFLGSVPSGQGSLVVP